MSNRMSRSKRHTRPAPVPLPLLLRRPLWISLLAILPGMAGAVDLQYEIGGSILRSDNVALSEDNPEAETVAAVELRFDVEQVGAELQLTATGDLAYLDYLGNTFAPELRGQLAGQLNWEIFPQRVNLVVEDYFSHRPVDTLSRFAPDNRQQINVFLIGPSFLIRPGETTRGVLDLRYRNNYAEKTTEFNGDVYSADAKVLHDLSPTDRISATASVSRSRFDEAGAFPDYTRRDVYASYQRILNKIDFTIDAGHSWMDLEDGGDSTSPLARASLDWRPTSRSLLSVDLRYQFADAATDVITRADELSGLELDLASAGSVVAAEPYRQRYLDLGYRFSGRRLEWYVDTYYESSRYVADLKLDNRVHAVIFGADYRLRRATSLSVDLARVDREFTNIARKDRDGVASVSLTQQFTRHWSASVRLAHNTRESTAEGGDYDENVASISVVYRR